jgi:hypothetical protein
VHAPFSILHPVRAFSFQATFTEELLRQAALPSARTTGSAAYWERF